MQTRIKTEQRLVADRDFCSRYDKPVVCTKGQNKTERPGDVISISSGSAEEVNNHQKPQSRAPKQIARANVNRRKTYVMSRKRRGAVVPPCPETVINGCIEVPKRKSREMTPKKGNVQQKSVVVDQKPMDKRISRNLQEPQYNEAMKKRTDFREMTELYKSSTEICDSKPGRDAVRKTEVPNSCNNEKSDAQCFASPQPHQTGNIAMDSDHTAAFGNVDESDNSSRECQAFNQNIVVACLTNDAPKLKNSAQETMPQASDEVNRGQLNSGPPLKQAENTVVQPAASHSLNVNRAQGQSFTHKALREVASPVRSVSHAMSSAIGSPIQHIPRKRPREICPGADNQQGAYYSREADNIIPSQERTSKVRRVAGTQQRGKFILSIKAVLVHMGKKLTRRFTVVEDLSFGTFLAQVERFFGLVADLNVSYQDEEGDEVGISTSNEFAEMISVARNHGISPLRLKVEAVPRIAKG